MSMNSSSTQLVKTELKSDAIKTGISTEMPVSRPLSEGERSAFEQQLIQIRNALSLDFSSPEFIQSAISQNKSPESYYEYLSKREAELSSQLNSGQYYYSLPTNEFFDYVISRYIISENSAKSFESQYQQKSKHFKIAVAAIVALIGISGFLFSSHFSDNPSTVEDTPPTSVQSTNLPPDNSFSQNDALPESNGVQPDEPELQTLPYPENGTILVDSGLNRVAPLGIKTDEGLAYYVKLCDMDNNEILGFFVGPNASVEVSAPLGTFELRYACGTTWYGTTPKFGDDTQYYKADTLLDFTDDGTYYNGHTVTLYAVPGGNLSTEEISPEEF